MLCLLSCEAIEAASTWKKKKNNKSEGETVWSYGMEIKFSRFLEDLYLFETLVFLSNYSEDGGALLRNLCTVYGR